MFHFYKMTNAEDYRNGPILGPHGVLKVERIEGEDYAYGVFYNTEGMSPVDTPELREMLVDKTPTKVSMRQARLALYQSNLLSKVEEAIQSLNDPSVSIEWEYAVELDRNHDWVQQLATALGLSERDLDELFLLAASL